MAAPTEPAAATGTLRISGITHRDFRERSEPVFGLDETYTRFLIDTCGYGEHKESLLRRTGNSFIAMSDALIANMAGRIPEVDTIMISYHTSDLVRSDVAGCYLADRLPGAAIPFSVAEQGAGGPFTALRIADGFCRLGESSSVAMFVYDQNGATWELDEPGADRPDAAALVLLGAHGDVAVTELTDLRTSEPGDPTAEQAFRHARARHPHTTVIVGPSLADVLGEETLAAPGVQIAAPHAFCSGLWAAVADRWPLGEPALLTDRQVDSGRFHSCLLTPDAES